MAIRDMESKEELDAAKEALLKLREYVVQQRKEADDLRLVVSATMLQAEGEIVYQRKQVDILRVEHNDGFFEGHILGYKDGFDKCAQEIRTAYEQGRLDTLSELQRHVRPASFEVPRMPPHNIPDLGRPRVCANSTGYDRAELDEPPEYMVDENALTDDGMSPYVPNTRWENDLL
jgi:hypothetical protein